MSNTQGAALRALLVGLMLLPAVAMAEPVRFLIVGDSWAEEQWNDGSHQRVFGQRGLSNVPVSGELTTTSGSTAADWIMPVNLDRIDAALVAYPHIDTVQLTIGGNDFLDIWNTGFDEQQFQALIADIRQDVEIIASYILSRREDIEIVLSLYDYPNFQDTRNGLIWTFACSPLWNSLGQPNPLVLNTAAVDVIDGIEDYADSEARIRHVRHLGRAQNFFGLPGQGPGTIPAPGDINLPSPLAAMRTRFLGGGMDCFHFNATAYDVLINNLVDGYVADRFQSGLEFSQSTSSAAYTGEPVPAVLDTSQVVDSLVVTYDGSLEAPVDAGTYAIVVTAPGWSGSFSGSWTIEQASQLIDFDPPATVESGTTSLTLEALSTSGLPVSFSVVSGPATVLDNVLAFTGGGPVVVQAEQSGDSNWLPAEPQQRTIRVPREDGLFQDRFSPES